MNGIEIDISGITTFLELPADQILLKILYTVGWIPIAVVFLYGSFLIWMDYINSKWGGKQKFMFLAIDIPRENSQSPRAVEDIFNYLAGTHGSFNLIEMYWEGKYQLSISLEIVSIDGYTQFLIHCPAHIRDVVESAFYAQYPDAEITEVNDYTRELPKSFPDEEYDLWGVEFNYSNNWVYPIKTYEEFMHQMGKPEEQFKDPMAALMDLCSSLKKGEQLWWQNIITPKGFDWMDAGEKEIKKILGEKEAAKDHIGDKLVDSAMGGITAVSEGLYTMWSDIDDVKKDDSKDEGMKMMNLKPVEKKRIEAITRKVSKTGYGLKSRFIYIAQKEVMNKPKVINGFVGFMKQFADLDLNNLRPEIAKTGTSAAYFFVDKRLAEQKRKIIKNYVNRSSSAGTTPGIMNTEELATMWHFPVEAVVKAPLIQKAAGRRAEPPASLPLDSSVGSDEFEHFENPEDDIFSNLHEELVDDSEASAESKVKKSEKKEPVSNLPFVDEAPKKEEIQKKEPPTKGGSAPGNLPFA